jgi:hypothetical protein
VGGLPAEVASFEQCAQRCSVLWEGPAGVGKTSAVDGEGGVSEGDACWLQWHFILGTWLNVLNGVGA